MQIAVFGFPFLVITLFSVWSGGKLAANSSKTFMLTCTDTDTRTILQVISIKRIREWSCFAWEECYTGQISIDTTRWNMFGHCNLSKLNAKRGCLTQILVKCFKTLVSTLYYVFFFFFLFLSEDQQKVGRSLQRGWQRERKRKIIFWFIFLWWRLTYYGDDQPYRILDSHNRPQRSHKVITVSVLIILVL